MSGAEVAIEWNGRPARAWLPDPLAARTLDLPVDLARATERAAAAVTRVGDRLPSSWEPLARLLLRAEGIASSNIEGLARATVASCGRRARCRRGHSRTPRSLPTTSPSSPTRSRTLEGPTGSPSTTCTSGTADSCETASSRPHLVGAFRDTQGWIGGRGPQDAAYVPPPAANVRALMDDLVTFTNSAEPDVVTQAAVSHAQFETIHPYGDGNGRIGRLLVLWTLARRLDVSVPPPTSVLIARDPGGYLSGLVLVPYRRARALGQVVRRRRVRVVGRVARLGRRGRHADGRLACAYRRPPRRRCRALHPRDVAGPSVMTGDTAGAVRERVRHLGARGPHDLARARHRRAVRSRRKPRRSSAELVAGEGARRPRARLSAYASCGLRDPHVGGRDARRTGRSPASTIRPAGRPNAPDDHADDRRAGDHAEVAGRGHAADRERGMAGLVAHVGDQQRPHERDAERSRPRARPRRAPAGGHNTSIVIPAAEIAAPNATVRRVPSTRDDRTAADARRSSRAGCPPRTRRRPRARRARRARAGRARPTSRCRLRPSPTPRTRARARVSPSWRRPDERAPHRRMLDARRARELRARYVSNPSTITTTAMPAHTTRHDAPSRSAMPVTVAPSTHAKFHSAWKRTSLPGSCGERVGRGDVEHDVDEAARRDRERHERRREQRRCAARTPRPPSREPQMISDRASVTPAPQRSMMSPPTAASAVAAMMPAARRKPELRVGEVERALDVDRGDRERAGVEAEQDEARGDRAQRRTHTPVSQAAFRACRGIGSRSGGRPRRRARSARPSGAGRRSGAGARASAGSRATPGSRRCGPRGGPSRRAARSDSGPRCTAGARDDRSRASPR